MLSINKIAKQTDSGFDNDNRLKANVNAFVLVYVVLMKGPVLIYDEGELVHSEEPLFREWFVARSQIVQPVDRK